MMNERLKQLTKELSDAINETLSESDQIADVVAKIKAGGYDVFLVLNATIGFNKRGSQDDTAVSAGRREGQFKIDAQDRKFLQALHIRVDDGA